MEKLGDQCKVVLREGVRVASIPHPPSHAPPLPVALSLQVVSLKFYAKTTLQSSLSSSVKWPTDRISSIKLNMKILECHTHKVPLRTGEGRFDRWRGGDVDHGRGLRHPRLHARGEVRRLQVLLHLHGHVQVSWWCNGTVLWAFHFLYIMLFFVSEGRNRWQTKNKCAKAPRIFYLCCITEHSWNILTVQNCLVVYRR